ncbi:uncharacterized protein LOC128554769 [Mercenaria mercenaria]|uniref:uncharacterized protein LOC128554769 n=1 Tax=Mercenaria mercenaria TaxID=6596 RepID=UPI00234F8FE3|nr:uncharacterized protein LOC128554769 [Mercenaria mercenaria]
MSGLLDPPVKKRKLQYDRSNLQRAFEATQKGLSVYRAAREYSVPESTLRDRTCGLVALDVTIGFDTIFSKDEEERLVNHITYMAGIGYGYSASSIKYMAKDYADSLGKNVKAKEALSNNWFYSFIKRWPNLAVVKPQKLSIARAKSASRETLNNYYKELATVLTTNHLRDKPQNIYNVDETGVNSEHSPPKVVCDKNTVPQNITSSRSSTVTIIAAGNALGSSIPPYYVFPGQRWNPEFLNGACPGADGEMSKTGWSNSNVFQNYLTKHFATYVKLSEDRSSTPTLILYDGHRSHISLTLTDWARKYNVILFVLPPHSSHVTQPLDVAVFGPFKSMYYTDCQAYMRRNPGANITKYQIAELTATPYLKALSATNLISAFRRTGIHPFDNKAILDSQVAPSVIYLNEQSQDTSEKTEPENPHSTSEASECLELSSEVTSHELPQSTSDFFQKRTITQAIPKKPKRKFVPPFLAGNLLKKSNTDILSSSAEKTKECCDSLKKSSVNSQQKKAMKKPGVNNQPKKAKSSVKIQKVNEEPKPSTSGTSNKGKPLSLISEDSSDSDIDTEVSEEEKCCVCGNWEPDELKGSVYITLVNWGKCDFCEHWTHLKTCSKIRVLRRDSVF